MNRRRRGYNEITSHTVFDSLTLLLQVEIEPADDRHHTCTRCVLHHVKPEPVAGLPAETKVRRHASAPSHTLDHRGPAVVRYIHARSDADGRPPYSAWPTRP